MIRAGIRYNLGAMKKIIPFLALVLISLLSAACFVAALMLYAAVN